MSMPAYDGPDDEFSIPLGPSDDFSNPIVHQPDDDDDDDADDDDVGPRGSSAPPADRTAEEAIRPMSDAEYERWHRDYAWGLGVSSDADAVRRATWLFMVRRKREGRMSESDADLLARAIVFDAGPKPTIGDWIMPEDADADGYSMQVVRHCGGWCVTGEAMMHLNPKDGGTWEFKTLAHHFASPSEAFAFLRGWKERERTKAGAEPWMKPWRDPRERDA